MLDLDDIRRRVETELTEFLAGERALLAQISPDLNPVADAVEAFVLNAGKRLRPAFCWWGAIGAGMDDSAELLRACASLELLQACALVHDDVMDGSDTRRGQPAVHRRFATHHQAHQWAGDADSFGTSAAILIGDLCLIWASRLLGACGLSAETVHRSRPIYDLMCTEVMSGQYLDVLEQVSGDSPEAVARALRVARYKSAKYTTERPLHLGGAFAGASPEVVDAYSAYGIPLGEAFQLRDDILGVFGDPEETGKPAGDDLREGKRTVLVALTLQRADQAQADLLHRHLGNSALDDAGVSALREVMTQTGALDEVEAWVQHRLEEALQAAEDAPITSDAREALRELALLAANRST